MTDLRKAAEMALDAMLSEYSTGGENKYSPWDVIEALRQALAQPEQERLSLRLDVGGGIARAAAACGDQIESVAQELPKREWVGLTDDERVKCYEISGHYQTLRPQDSFAVLSLARAIEAKLKEKNT